MFYSEWVTFDFHLGVGHSILYHLQAKAWVMCFLSAPLSNAPAYLQRKSAFYHIRNISHVRRYLNVESTEKLVHALVHRG